MRYLAATLFQLDYLINLLGTGSGMILAALIMIMFLFSFGRPGRWVVLAILLFTSTLSFGTDALQNPLIAPLQQMRFAAEPITLMLLIFLVIPSFLSQGAPLRTPVLAAAIVFWTLEMTYSAHVAISAELQRGVLSMVIFTTILVVMGIGMPRWFRGLQDVQAAARCMGAAALLFILGTTAQLLVNQSAIIHSNRLYAITSNPQHAAFILAILLIPISVLLASSREPKALRILWGATAGVAVAMIIWTGSRTGVLTALVGIGLLFRRRIGTFLGVGFVIAIFVFFFLAIFKPDTAATSRLVSTLDTRTGVWMLQFQRFQANPFFGTMSQTDYTAAESSYLTIAAHTGILGLALLGGVLWFMTTAIRRLRRLRATLRIEDDRLLVDWAPAGLIAILIGAFFEGVLVGTINFMLLGIYFYLAILKFLSDKNTIELAEQHALNWTEIDPAPEPYHPRPFLDAPAAL
ncbi:MAG TPA: hypothetical protein VG326_03480 [Tepidisphaeraceae bacterium]|nr:hypothetical protein [Tepidisphaeraceae bacterium]